MLVQHVFCSAHLAASSCAEAGTALAAVAAGRRSAPTGSTGLTGTFPHDPNIKALGITLAADFGRCLPLPTAVWFLVGAGPSTLPPTSSRRFASARARSRVRSSLHLICAICASTCTTAPFYSRGGEMAQAKHVKSNLLLHPHSGVGPRRRRS
jgi:hypothetical protein